MIFDLVREFADVLGIMPAEHPRYRILKLLDEAIRRDVNFINWHPTTFFQSMWNTCWWYDCPEAADHYAPPASGWPAAMPPWARRGPQLYLMLESWRRLRERTTPGISWLRSRRAPPTPLGSPVRSVYHGHSHAVTCVALAPDGKRFASASADGTIRLWDVNSGREIGCLAEHKDVVTSVAFAPDGRHLLSGSWDNTVRLWDETGACQKTLVGHQYGVESVAFSPDGKWIASASRDQTGQIWDRDTGLHACFLRGHAGFVTSVRWSPDGAHIVTGSTDKTVRLWDARTGSQLHCFSGHQGGVMAVCYSPDGQHIASASADKSCIVWHVGTRAPVRSFQKHEFAVWSICYSSDGRWIASGADDRTVCIVDAWTGAEVMQLRGFSGGVRGLAFFSGQRRLLTGSDDHAIRDWDLTRAEATEAAGVLTGHKDLIHLLTFSPSGQQIATAALDDTIRLWDNQTARQLGPLEAWEGPVRTLDYSRDGEYLLSENQDARIMVWSAYTGRCMGHAPKGAIPLSEGPSPAPLTFKEHETGMVVSLAGSNLDVAWFSTRMPLHCPHPSGRSWAGAEVEHLRLLTLEGALAGSGLWNAPEGQLTDDKEP